MGLGALLAATAASTCGQLEPRKLGVCGNLVIDENEECEPNVAHPEGLEGSCAPDGVHRCRFVCDHTAVAHGCPKGFGCGTDDVCRRATGQFEHRSTISGRSGLWYTTTDFDGDHSADIAVQHETFLEIHHVDGEHQFDTRRQPLDCPRGSRIEPRDLDGDGHTDLALPWQHGLAVFKGSADRTLLATLFPTYVFDQRVVRVVPGDFGAHDGHGTPLPGDEALLLLDRKVRLLTGGSTAPRELLVQAPAPAADLAARALVADLGQLAEQPPGWQADEVVVSYVDAHRLHVWGFRPRTAADPTPDDGEPARLVAIESSVELALGDQLVSAPMAVDLDGDEHVDLLVAGAPGPPPAELRLHVAYGTGAGSFHSAPWTAPLPPTADSRTSEFELPGGIGQCLDTMKMPLALGDLDGDDELDVVLPGGVWLSGAGVSCASGELAFGVPHPDGGKWSTARIADFDRDGHLDLAASSRGVPGLDFFVGTATGRLNPFKIPTSYGVVAMEVGDFDGDGLRDLVVAEKGSSGGGAQTLTVAFGQPAGPPAEPVRIGATPPVHQLLRTDRVQGGDSFLDDTDEVVVVAGWEATASDQERPTEITVVYGSGDRQLQAPFYLAYTDPDQGGLAGVFRPLTVASGTFGLTADPEQPGEPLARTGIIAESEDVNESSPASPERLLAAITMADDGSAKLLGQPSRSYWSVLEDTLPRSGPNESVVLEDFHRLMTATDLDGDGLDTVVVIGAFVDQEAVRTLMVLVPSFDATSENWGGGAYLSLANTALVGFPPSAADDSPALAAHWSGGLNNALVPCTFTPDQPPTLVTHVLDYAGTPEGARAESSSMLLLPSELLASLEQGDDSRADRVGRITVPSTVDDGDGGTRQQALVGFACIAGDGVAGQELAMLVVSWTANPSHRDVRAALHLVHPPDPGEPNMTLAPFTEPSWQTSKSDLPALARILNVPDGSDDSSGGEPPLSGLAAGDVNGDGVQDLVLGSDIAMYVLYGTPEVP